MLYVYWVHRACRDYNGIGSGARVFLGVFNCGRKGRGQPWYKCGYPGIGVDILSMKWYGFVDSMGVCNDNDNGNV